MSDLSSKLCVPCESGMSPMSVIDVAKYSAEIPEWRTSIDFRKISREFKFKDFKEAMAFANKVAETAETEGHHPDLHIFYDRVNIELQTHALNGLSENDFILAAKINTRYEP